jgi:UDPglucose 6-dehydrogenase
MRISVFGTGYVGLVTSTCCADLGNQVIGVDIDAAKIERLRRGEATIYEPGLQDLLERQVKSGRLEFTTDDQKAVDAAEVIFICVGTPPRSNGEADLTYVVAAAKSIGRHMRDYKVVVNKSTVPVGTFDVVRRAIQEAQAGRDVAFDVVSNPEFLREGMAIYDFQNPERIVVGTDSERARATMEKLYRPIARVTRPIVFTTIPSAELIKYASNAMLATRISFMNEISHLCEAVGADIGEVSRGMGLDSRIGSRFLQAGIGYGGSCFPKDVKALAAVLEYHGLASTLLQAVDHINERQKRSLVQKLRRLVPGLEGKTFAVWGLAFKPRTDDVREAPSLTVVEQLLREYASVRCFDPEANETFKQATAGLKERFGDRLHYAQSAYEALEGADALLLLTEWDEFREPDFARMKELLKQPLILDGRNIYNPADIRALGFTYVGVGR